MRDTVRQYVRERVLPVVADLVERGELPRGLGTGWGGLGLLAACTLEGYGCAGASAWATGSPASSSRRATRGCARSCRSRDRWRCSPIWRFGSEEQKEEWLPRMAAGEAIGCFGLTEPDAGSDPGSMRTRARRDGEDWMLNGTKMWITNGSMADVAIVWARTEEGIRGFLVPTDTPGVHNAGHPQEAVPARLGDVGADPRRRAPPGRGHAARRARLKGPLSCLGEARFGIVSAPTAPAAPATRRPWTTRGSGTVRQADRRLPAHPGQARGDARRGQPGRAAGAAPRADEGRGPAAARARAPRQAGQRQRGAVGGARGAPGARGATGSRSSTR